MTHDIPNVLQRKYKKDKTSGVTLTFGSCLTKANIMNFGMLSNNNVNNNIDIYPSRLAHIR